MTAPTILEVLDDPALLGGAFAETSWRPWRAFLGALFGLQLPEDLAQLARHHTGRSDILAAGPFREAWLVVGRRAGKSRILAAIAVYLAAFHDWRPRLAAGEIGVVMILAADRDQASVLLGYVKGLIAGNPMLSRLVTGEAAERVELATLRVAIEVHTSSFRAVRGRTVIAALCDEVAFWRSDTSTNPAGETVRALRPALATLSPDSILIGASSPYARQGLLWDQHRRHHGEPGSRVLVWKAATRDMNASIPAELVADALEEDPEGAAAEWLAEFRRDVERFCSLEALAACTVPGRHELSRVAGVTYHAFCDPSGGSQDSFTLAIAHREGDRAVLDLVRETKPPFNPEATVAEFADVLRSYGVTRVTSDRFGGIWVATAFHAVGIFADQSAKPKSDLYGELLPVLNSGRVELLDHPRLVAQLGSLERRTSRSGRDSIDHCPGGHDDVANAAAGALLAALARPVAQIRSDDFIIGRPLVAMTLLDPTPNWRTAF